METEAERKGFMDSTIHAHEEFFDAEDEVESLKKDEDDFFHKLEMAIGSDEPPVKLEGLTISQNDAKKKNEILKESTSHGKSLPKNNSPIEFDAEKLEDELLKDLIDDNNDDLYAVSKEVEDLVDSVIDTFEEPKSLSKNTENNPLELPSNQHVEKTDQDVDTPADVDSELQENKKNGDIVTSGLATDQVFADREIFHQKTTEEDETVDADKKEANPITDDLLVACASPKRKVSSEDQISSEVSSNSGDGPTLEDSSDCDKPTTKVNGIGSRNVEENDLKKTEDKKNDENLVEEEKMEIDDVTDVRKVNARSARAEVVFDKELEEELHLCIVQEGEPVDEPEETSLVSSPPKVVQTTQSDIPFKMRFMRKFSSAVGELSRPELEELLIEKIAESIMYCSETTEMRGSLRKLENSFEVLKKRFDNVQKQYNDLEMIHNRVMKDLKDRPESPITPVKITRAVGLQVYQPLQRSKHGSTTITLTKPTNKRTMEHDGQINGNTPTTPDNIKRKKTLKTTPMRPPLSDKERATLELQEAKEQQNLLTNVSKSLSGGSLRTITPNVTMTAVTTNSGMKKSPAVCDNSQVIDLSDDEADDSVVTPITKVAPNQLPPALVAIQSQLPVRNPVGTKLSNASQQNRIAQFRANVETQKHHPANLPIPLPQPMRPGWKKVPPKPAIKITNVQNGIIVSWTVDALKEEHADIHSYQIYAYEVTNAAPSSENWRHVGDVKALLLPMAVTLTQFQEGLKYYFAVRAVDVHKRLGAFSVPRTWTDK